MDFRLDRRAFTVTTFADQKRTNPALTYWRSRPAQDPHQSRLVSA